MHTVAAANNKQFLRSRNTSSLLHAYNLAENQNSSGRHIPSENCRRRRTSHPAVPNETVSAAAQELNRNAFIRQIQGISQIPTEAANVQNKKGRTTTAARPVIDTWQQAAWRIKRK